MKKAILAKGGDMIKRLVVGGLLLLGLVATPIASGNGATNVFVDEVNPVISPCTGEEIVFEVRAHFLFRSSADASGGSHELERVHGQRVIGVSETGRHYTGKFVGTSIQNGNGPNGQTESTGIVQFRVVSQGGSDNFFLTLTFHTTVNANGEPTADFTRFDEECRG